MNDIVAFLIYFIIGSSILFCCYLSIRIIFTYSFFRSPFGYICASQTFAEFAWAMCYTFYAAPMCLWGPKGTIETFSVIMGQTMVYFNFLTLFMLLAKSFNRFHAIIFPIHYRTKFTNNIAKIIIGIQIILAFLCSIPFLSPDCNLYFNNTLYFWATRILPCELGSLVHGTVLMGVVITTVICDGITLFYTIIFKKKLQQISALNYAKEKKFFFQTCIATIFHVMAFLCTYVFVKYVTTLEAQFFFYTPPWLMFTLSNELTFVLFSYHSLKKSKSVTMSKITVVNGGKTRNTING